MSRNIKIEKYFLKNNEVRYRFKIFIGTDELTGKPKGTTRSGFKTVKEAKEALGQLQRDIDDGMYQPKSVETYGDIYKIWVENYENTVQDSTFLKTVRIFENHILPAMGEYRLEKITTAICQQHVNKWYKQLKRFNMVKNYAAKVIKFAVKHGYIRSNPFEHVEIPIIKKRVSLDEPEENENFYSREQLIEFLDALKKEGNLKKLMFFRLLAFSGMRKGEAFALTWKDINFETNTIRINKAVTRGKEGLYLGPPKNGLPRTIKMDETTMQLLHSWKKELAKILLQRGINSNQPKQFVFPNSFNTFTDPSKSYSWLKHILDKYQFEPITTHGLRHTHCSLLFEAGANVKDVQDRLGHKDVKITLEIYTHITQKSKTETIDKFANYLSI